MDYYQTLGIKEDADQDEIRAAYKKLAMKNHPDRGGDTKRFQEISQAYDTLSDPQKKAQYDAQKNGFNPFGQRTPFEHVNEMFNFHFGGNPHFGQGFAQHRRNKDLTIRMSISLRQSYIGTQIEARYKTPNGNNQTVLVDIPPGISNGQTIRYNGLGDNSIPNLPKGNLNVQILVEPDPKFDRIGNHLYTNLRINVLEAMIGCKKEVEHIDGSFFPLTIRPGITDGTEFGATKKGFRDVNTGVVGDMFIKIKIDVPAVTNPEIKAELEALYARIS